MNCDEALSHYYLQQMGIDCWVPRAEVAELPLATQISWDELYTQVSQCRACSLCETRSNVVFGVGDKQARLLIVGEAPGFYEDQQAQPFVGRAGQLLNAMLHSIGLTRQQVYIANVLKCRPPANRDPRPEEVIKCTPFLAQQIALLKPKIILAVGRHAAHYLLGTTQSLAKLRNTRHTWGQQLIPLVVSYHPAYLLRNPVDKKQAFDDLQLVKTMLNDQP